MPINIHTLFENELQRRGYAFNADAESRCYSIEINGSSNCVSIENLQRVMAVDFDLEHITHFINAIEASSQFSKESSQERLYWCLEPNDYQECARYRVAVSDRIDRVLVHLSSDEALITWVTSDMLESMGISEAAAEKKAFSNLADALQQATIEIENVDGISLAFLNSPLPFKSSLILAPNMGEVVGKVAGWPLLAVAPDRGFLYLWAAKHRHFVSRVGAVVVREYSQAPYPLSTEVYEISDEGVEAIGGFSQKI